MKTKILDVIPKMHTNDNDTSCKELLSNRMPVAKTKRPQSDSKIHFSALDKTMESLLQQGFRVTTEGLNDSNSLKITPATITIMSDSFYDPVELHNDSVSSPITENLNTSHLFSVKYTLISNESKKQNITYDHYSMKQNNTYDEIGIWTGEGDNLDDWAILLEKLKKSGVEDIIIT